MAHQVSLFHNFKQIEPHLTPNARILEVGCGRAAHLAHHLAGLGFDVTGVDPAVTQLDAPNMRLICKSFVEFEADSKDPLYDVVLFTKSLHHIEQLETAVDKAVALLKKGGILLVQDSERHHVDIKTITWAFSMVDTFSALGFKKKSHHGHQHEHHHQQHHQQVILSQVYSHILERLNNMRRKICGRDGRGIIISLHHFIPGGQ